MSLAKVGTGPTTGLTADPRVQSGRVQGLAPGVLVRAVSGARPWTWLRDRYAARISAAVATMPASRGTTSRMSSRAQKAMSSSRPGGP
jgi:hypothetical protein